MKVTTVKIFLTVLVISAWNLAYAETSMFGKVGLDLENYRLSKALKDTVREFSADRSLSNHFINLTLGGPMITEKLATYTANSVVYGTYFNASTDNANSDTYIKPNLYSYNASMTLFPKRAYPIGFYLSRSRDNSVRYEANNRTKVDILQPELAIIRRYRGETNSRGTLWRASFSENIYITTEYKQDRMKVRRNYDFGENRDIWVVFTTLRPDPTAPLDTIEVLNSIEDDTVMLFIDYGLIDSIGPGESIFVEVDSGLHDIEIIPFTYNPYRNRIEVRGRMTWKILYEPPSTPNDIDNTITSASGILHFEKSKGFLNETRYEYTASNERVQRMVTYLSNFTNEASYEFNRNLALLNSTSYSQTQTALDTISSTLDKSFMNTVSLNWSSRKRISTILSHMFMRNSSTIENSYLQSNTHMLTNQNTVSFKPLDYKVEIRNLVTLLSDNTGYRNNQYGTDITNSIEFRLGGISLQPRNQTRYGYNVQKNPDLSGSEIENKSILAGEIPKFVARTKLKFKGELEWRRRASSSGDNIKKRYALNASMEKSFFEKYRISLSVAREKESYGGSKPTPGENADQRSPAREPQISSSLRIDFQAMPHKNLTVSGNCMINKPKSGKIIKYGATVIAMIPKLNIPIKTFLVAQKRELAGLPAQTQLSLNTKLSYRFRQIAITFGHTYTRESLIRENYDFQEILGEVSRQFNVF